MFVSPKQSIIMPLGSSTQKALVSGASMGSRLEPLLEKLLATWHCEHGVVFVSARELGGFLSPLCVGCVTGLIGAPTVAMGGASALVLLDGAWRLANGQRPHIDFYSALGPVWFLPASWGLHIFNNNVDGVAWGTALVGAIVGIWSFLVCRKEMRGLLPAFVATAVALLAVAPFPIGVENNFIGYGMQYNRYGYALLAIVTLQCFQRRDDIAGRVDWGAFSTGIACCLLLFLKASYFTVAVGLIAVGYAIKGITARTISGFVLGLLLVAGVFFVYFNFSFQAMIADLQLAASARASSVSLGGVLRILVKQIPDVLFAAIIGLLCQLQGFSGVNSQRFWRRYYFLIVSLSLIAAQTILILSNAQRTGFPLNIVLVALWMNEASIRYLEANRSKRITLLAATATVLFVGMWALVSAMSENSLGMLVALRQRSESITAPGAAHANQSHMSGLAFYDFSSYEQSDKVNGHAYIDGLNEGIELIAAHSTPNDPIVCICLENRFSYPLLRKPARGGANVLQYGITYNRNTMPAARRLIGNAKVVVVAKPGYGEDIPFLSEHVHDQLEKNFRGVAESSQWQVYVSR